MKAFLFTFLTVFCALALEATEKPVTNRIKEVTVFLEGAQVVREGNIRLSAGNNTLVFKNLPPSLKPESVQLEGKGNFVVLSVSHRLDYLAPQQDGEKIQELQQRAEILSEQVQEHESLLAVYQEEEKLLLENRQLGGEQGLSVERLRDAADFYRSRFKEIKLKELALKKQISVAKEEERRLNNSMRELSATKEEPSSTVLVAIESPAAMDASLRLTYLVEQAGWFPGYDIRVKEVEEPLSLHYKAQVFQQSGEDWNDIQLTISTGNPESDNTKPQLHPQWVNYPEYVRWQHKRNFPAARQGMVQGQVVDASRGEPLPGISVVVKGTTVGVVTNYEGYYSLHLPAGSEMLVFSFVGFSRQEVPVNNRSRIDVVLEEDVRQLEEVVVTGYGGRVSGVSGSQKKEVSRSPDVARMQNQLTSEFVIRQPYTIPSDGKQYQVAIQQHQLPAMYQYYAAPSVEVAAFLTASITGWENLDLLAGEASLFFEGKYVGKTLLDPLVTTDTLEISLGRDKNVQVERKELKEYTKSSFFSGKKKEEKKFVISIRNGKQKPVRLLLEDRVPVAKISEIAVEATTLSGGEYQEENGLVRWNLSIEPKTTVEKELAYTLRYPGSRKIVFYE